MKKIIALLVLFLSLLLFVAQPQFAVHAITGWYFYLANVLPKVTIQWDGVAFFLFGVALFTVLLHRIAVWLRREMTDQAVVWRWRSTLQIVGLTIMTFVAGIAMVCVTHQFVWLATAEEPLSSPALSGGYYSTPENFQRVFMGMANYNDTRRALPTTVGLNRPEQSWVSQILPYMFFASELDREKPWNDEVNQEQARRLVPPFLNPQVRPLVLRDSEGYGVSHYAGNRNVFERENPITLQAFAGGSSHTIMAGEIDSNFQAWAKPRTNRDPALGLNRSADGFGNPAGNETQFLMSDGSVKKFSRDTDPAVLKALSGVDR